MTDRAALAKMNDDHGGKSSWTRRDWAAWFERDRQQMLTKIDASLKSASETFGIELARNELELLTRPRNWCKFINLVDIPGPLICDGWDFGGNA